MNIWDRIMSFFSAVFVAITSAVLFLVLRPINQSSTIGTRLHNLIFGNALVGIAIGVIALAIVIYLLFLSIRSYNGQSNDMPSGSNNNARSVVKPTSMGDVRISLSAIEDLVMKVAKKHPQVKEAASRVGGDIDTLHLNIKMDVYSDAVIPTLCEELETEISEVVKQMIGVEVKTVHFDINSVSGDVLPKRPEPKPEQDQTQQI